VSFAAAASGVVSAPSIDAAYEVVCDAIHDQLQAKSWVVEWTGDRWAVRGPVALAPAVDECINRIGSGDRCTTLTVHASGATAITIVTLDEAPESTAVLVIEGDWTSIRQPLIDGAQLLALALRVVLERTAKLGMADVLVDGYARIRRLSRLGSMEEVAQRVVKDVAAMLGAARVSMALYRPDAGDLTIVATEGLSLADVEDVRILPGDWVIGHVYSSRRPVFVRDAKVLPSFALNSARYRTSSFAAVPMLAGAAAVGVITVTDKHDGRAFSPGDELVLRTLAAAAAVAMVAARSNGEVTRLELASTIDALTGLLNRPGLDHRIHEEIQRKRREAGSLAVLMADVDDFKTINDTRGHPVGDAVLKLVAQVIRSSVRVFDVCARYGGDEFAVVMPNSDRENAIQCAERIRQRLAERAIDDDLGRVSISIGVAVLAPGDVASDIVARADQCLYRAKADGKNVVRADSPQVAGVVIADPMARDDARMDTRVVAIEDGRARQPAAPGLPPATELRYVLAVDSQSDRAALCLEAVAPFQVGFLKARDGQQATGIIDRFGAPVLLVVDLSLPVNNGFELVEHLRARYGDRSEVVAWAASREMREYAGARLRGLGVHVIGGDASRAMVRGAIERALVRQAPPPTVEAVRPVLTAEQVQRITAELTYAARQIVQAAGVAVYLQAPGEQAYRATFSWDSDQPIPHSTTSLPRAFHEIAEHGRSSGDALRGLIGVPIARGSEILGALCVFDIVPITMSHGQIVALEKLGRRAVDAISSDPANALAPAAHTAPLAAERPAAILMNRPSEWPAGLLERVGGEFAVARELTRARREGVDLSVALFEIAPLGEEIVLGESIAHASDTLLKTIRQSDLPIRWSGREFVVVLPGLSGAVARTVAERVRAALQAAAPEGIAVAGIVTKLEGDESFGDVVSRARARARLARGGAPNRIVDMN
jgi:diguanylate cyclase (GGDEF)-like protein